MKYPFIHFFVLLVFFVGCNNPQGVDSTNDGTDGNTSEVESLSGPMKTISSFSIPTASNLEMIWCPPGTFMMGSPESEKGRTESHHVAEYRTYLEQAGQKSFETQHKVTLDGFYLSKYEVTRKQWYSVLGVSLDSDSNIYKPMANISWRDITGKFLPKLNELESSADRLPAGWKYNLPTEAQWEYACRAGTTTPYWWGDDGNYTKRHFMADSNTTADVGSYPPNPWGFYDMQGNVWEKTADYFAPYPTEDTLNPTGPTKPLNLPMSPIMVGRGASFHSGTESGRSAYRGGSPNWGYAPNMGFRIALARTK